MGYSAGILRVMDLSPKSIKVLNLLEGIKQTNKALFMAPANYQLATVVQTKDHVQTNKPCTYWLILKCKYSLDTAESAMTLKFKCNSCML